MRVFASRPGYATNCKFISVSWGFVVTRVVIIFGLKFFYFIYLQSNHIYTFIHLHIFHLYICVSGSYLTCIQVWCKPVVFSFRFIFQWTRCKSKLSLFCFVLFFNRIALECMKELISRCKYDTLMQLIDDEHGWALFRDEKTFPDGVCAVARYVLE